MSKLIDMSGWKMWEHGIPDSKITVIKRAEDSYTSGGNKIINWLCQCSCSNFFVCAGNKIRSGNTKSCGCYKKNSLKQRNLNSSTVKIGNKYGKLTVIKDLGLRKQSSRNKNERWSLCQCDCGSEPIEVKNNMLQSGWKKSCGCLQSQGEFTIETILLKNNIQYIKEYSFLDLYVKSNSSPLRFDFAIFEGTSLKRLVEFDGKQHYTGPESKWTQGHSLEEIQKYDLLKNQYCKENNIPLVRIPYWEQNNITLDLILGDKYLIDI